MRSLSLSTLPVGRAGAARALPLPARWAWLNRIGMVLVMVTLCACTKMVGLQGGLNDGDANEIVALLNRYGIEAEKTVLKGVVSLQVREDELARATDAMHSAGLPRRSLSDLGQVFKKEGMISTPLEERVRYLHGISQELEYTLQQIDHVVAARVHVVLPERIAPGEPIQPSSAAVFIKFRPPFDEDVIVPRIRNLVASSIPGLSGEYGADKVSIILTPGENVAPEIPMANVFGVTVLASSAAFLTNLVVGLGVLATLLLLGLAASLAMRNEKVALWVKDHFGKEEPLQLEPATANQRA
ncbi:MAG: type III secretion inner membrane ring lipoprotein SctJ [Pseudomonadota bacterium]